MAKLCSFAQQSACAAGGYFFRFAGKSNQKGATSLEEAIFFLCRAGLYCNVVPAHTATGAE
ncbi:MAG: hypothetical protein LBO63_08905 [Oscillospiraceae bacterium]|nr:hypothetical protein [Oscillospiraceae bacterium]